ESGHAVKDVDVPAPGTVTEVVESVGGHLLRLLEVAMIGRNEQPVPVPARLGPLQLGDRVPMAVRAADDGASVAVHCRFLRWYWPPFSTCASAGSAIFYCSLDLEGGEPGSSGCSIGKAASIRARPRMIPSAIASFAFRRVRFVSRAVSRASIMLAAIHAFSAPRT